MRAAKPPTEPPTSAPMWECLVGIELEADPATLLVTELTRVLWLPSGVRVWVMTIMLGPLEPGVDRLLLEGSFVGVVLVEGVRGAEVCVVKGAVELVSGVEDV